MNINWKLRYKNKFTLAALIAVGLDFIYCILAIFNIVPSISKDTLVEMFNALLDLLGILGIIIDPTTEGMSDSVMANTYDNPKVNMPDALHTDTEYKG